MDIALMMSRSQITAGIDARQDYFSNVEIVQRCNRKPRRRNYGPDFFQKRNPTNHQDGDVAKTRQASAMHNTPSETASHLHAEAQGAYHVERGLAMRHVAEAEHSRRTCTGVLDFPNISRCFRMFLTSQARP